MIDISMPDNLVLIRSFVSIFLGFALVYLIFKFIKVLANKSSLISFLVLILFSLISFLITGLYFSFSNQNDYIVAKSLPRYSKASAWKISSSNGFPDGKPGATIEFQHQNSTIETNSEFVDTYVKQLEDNGWKLASIERSWHAISDKDESRVLKYTKKIGSNTYQVSLLKSIHDSYFIEKYSKDWLNRELIFVSKKD